MKFISSLFVCVLLFGAALSQEGYCVLKGTSNDAGITGTVLFTVNSLDSSKIDVTVTVSGITQNAESLHGMHVHSFGDLSDAVAANTGTHWNPTGTVHSCPDNSSRHYGDMGNWQATGGAISETKTLDLLALTGTNSIIGRAVILHNATDDCVQNTTGNAGSRLASCVIGIRSVASNSATGQTTQAICELTPTTGNTASGRVIFIEESDFSVTVMGYFDNLVNTSIHGLHVHQYGDLSLNNGTSVGGHWNPTNSTHGIPPFTPRHYGDLGNIYYYDANGRAWFRYDSNDLLALSGSDSIVGRAVVLHANTDDCTNPVGNAGSRLAFCVIGVRNTAVSNTTWPADAPVIPTTQDTSACVPATSAPATSADGGSSAADGSDGADGGDGGDGDGDGEDEGEDDAASVLSVASAFFALLFFMF